MNVQSDYEINEATRFGGFWIRVLAYFIDTVIKWVPAIAFDGPRSSWRVLSARHQDSRKDLTPCRMAEHFVSAGAYALDSDQTLGPTSMRGLSHSARRLRSLASLCFSDVHISRPTRVLGSIG